MRNLSSVFETELDAMSEPAKDPSRNRPILTKEATNIVNERI